MLGLRLCLYAWLDPIVQRINELAFWYGRRFFDIRYLQEDPWRLRESAYEAERHAELIATVPYEPCRVLEIGCGEGVFTARLATARPRLSRFVGIDISRRAVRRARGRCAPFAAVEIVQGDVARDLPPGPFNVIFCVEVLPYLGTATKIAAVGEAIAARLAPGGVLVASHAASVATRVHRAIRTGAPALSATARVGGHPRRWEIVVLRAAR